ncbi:MAG: hypothetical protein A2138_08030 [Deltaproteobacteria bacterium RBG_16_71_12]|nr:MAG: hypothetical protein A2138_08030 [Deltaproteobacteria bacterium RBG_16_71_12]
MAPASLLRTLLAVLGVAGALGCDCFFDPTLPQCVGEQDGGPELGPCEDGSCAVTSAGCDGTAVERNVGETCASCETADGDVVICGEPTVAECELRFDAEGEECRYCATDVGEVLFDDCFVPGAEGPLACEPAPVDPNDPASADMACAVCRDERGVVVENRCEPASDECHAEVLGDATCRVCTRDGEVVVQDCAGAGEDRLDPDYCEAYANEAGRCVDCWTGDVLLSHRCSDTTVPVSCVESVTVDGLWCRTCVDANGIVVDQMCSPDVPEPQQCEVLAYTDQTCVVCLDQFGAVTSTTCERTDCEAGAVCEPPPPCWFEYADDGSLCRSCPADAGYVETQCIGEPALYCEEQLDPTQRCTVCYDLATGVEVYRDCGGAPPPSCETLPDGEGTTACEVCYDPGTGAPIYSSCNGLSCSALGSFALVGVDGAPLYVDNAPAVASCRQCAETATTGDPVNGDVHLSCDLRDDCGNTTELLVDAPCPTSVVFEVAPQVCGNPWEADATLGGAPGSLDELLGVLSWALSTHQLAAVALDHQGALDAGACTECGCRRGDRLLLEVRAQDAARAAEAFGAVLERCATDDDCGGGLCRLDGSCAPP